LELIVNAAESDAPAMPGAVTNTSSSDERISYRGPLRRWLISPEIGALIGAVVVWLFLWGNGQTFGTAGTTLNWLDSAAPYGIMATAIALLMIGGEFDLSSGVLTGASAMMIGLISRFMMGEGVHIGFAILVSFAVAGSIGWANGYLVVKTGLPSFIITLSSFFIIQGLMLVMSKRLADKVYAHKWELKNFAARDKIFLTLVFVGIAMFVFGLLEQAFNRRSSMSPKGLGVLAVGLAGAVAGFVGIHTTDGVTNNFVFGGLGVVGLTLTVVGVGLARFVERSGVTTGSVPNIAQRHLGLGLLLVAAACVVPLAFDRNERKAVLTWTPDGLRPVLAIIAIVVGAGLAGRAALRGLGEARSAGGMSRVAMLGIFAGLMVMALSLSVLQLTTVQAVRAMAMVILGTAGITFLFLARTEAGKANRLWHLIIGVVISTALIILGLISRIDSSATRFREVLPAALALGAGCVLANSVLEFALEKRTLTDPAVETLSRRVQIIGGLLMAAGIAVRLCFINYTVEEAAKRKAAGLTTPSTPVRETVLWWILIAGIGAYVLGKTKWGNWIFAVGGNRDAARAVGVPADSVKIGLFVVVGLCGALAGTLIALRYGTVQANQGIGLELEYIIAAVVGGCLMTGGYGTVIGATLGASVLAMSQLGFQTVSGWNSDARYVFLGGVLLIAVLVNNFVRKKASAAR
jgi:ribose/xylose/arabinose/galactoside ABC-type transport system permease subunit